MYNLLFFFFLIGFSLNKDENKVFIVGIFCKMIYFIKIEICCIIGLWKGIIEIKV